MHHNQREHTNTTSKRYAHNNKDYIPYSQKITLTFLPTQPNQNYNEQQLSTSDDDEELYVRPDTRSTSSYKLTNNSKQTKVLL